jgi:hypothetical protein
LVLEAMWIVAMGGGGGTHTQGTVHALDLSHAPALLYALLTALRLFFACCFEHCALIVVPRTCFAAVCRGLRRSAAPRLRLRPNNLQT